ncbi:hypothetical protein [Photorhabdus khanii]|uniref:Uncharacterized protein n=1 Tax=Photorhabdus khanii subsp. guanajuatensis TaxID=2100166 RepID=A0A4R4JUV8_9GAMM|nr:hypothetical protein [Photorhabdus khanii]TDB57846.1 hypothetical protein C5467_10670 [Photorhabdus khanii subsp. guanajuatensis]
MSLEKLSRLVDQQRKTQSEINDEIILAVKEVLATNSVGLARELVGCVPQDHPFHPFLLVIAKQLDPR